MKTIEKFANFYMKYFFVLILSFTISDFLFSQDYYCKHHYNKNLQTSEIQDDIAIKYLKLNIKTEASSTYLSASALMNIKITDDSISSFILLLINDYSVDSIKYYNQNLNFSHQENQITINLPNVLYQNDTFSVEVFYHGQTQGLWGISSAVNPVGKRTLWTLSESYHAHEWWPCRESLKYKLDSVDIWITVPKTEKAGANGILTRISNIDNNYHRFEWKHRHKIAYYLISIAVSDYLEYNFYAHMPYSGDSVLVQNFVYNDTTYFLNNKANIDKTVDLLEFYSSIYGDYPFADEKYGHCQAPFGGGMEHQTMCTIKDFGFRLNSHELAHQWFGDLVTCADWQDIWINEGFAAYSEYLASVRYETPDEALAVIRFKQEDAMSQSGGSVYIPAIEIADESRVFSGRLTYSKGAAIIHQIRYILNNDSVFFQTLRNYLIQFKDSFATGEDFKTILEQTSGKDFDSYFQQWYYGEGYPVYGINWSSTNNSFFCKINQTTSTNTISFFDIPLEFKLKFNNGNDTIIRYEPQTNIDSFTVNVTDSVTDVILDPYDFVMEQVSYISNISDKPVNKFEIFPNPCSNFLKINSKFEIEEVSVINTYGKTVNKYITNSKNLRINLSELENGIYFLRLKQKNKTVFYKKIIKL